MIVVVSDTSPILALHHLGLIPILGKMFERVAVPPAVKAELDLPRPKFEVVDISRYEFIDLRTPHDAVSIADFRRTLDIGESEALALALEINAQAILIDEASGRAVAAERHLLAIGTLGILLRAKELGYVDRVRPLVERLVSEIDFFVSQELKRHVFELAGE